VEDRSTPGLYLELVDIDRDAYLGERAPSVLSRPGVERLTCWDNAWPNRDDLPRRLEEFGWLAVYEVDDEFTPPAECVGVRGLHFRRTARPGQGHLTDGATLGLLLVLISPPHEEDAVTLRAWGDFVHIRHIAEAAVPGYTMITPYEAADRGHPRFLHFYEMDTEAAEVAFKSMTPMVAERLGGPEAPEFRAWATDKSLRIDYVSSFSRAGPSIGPLAS
jgi:hypothetical protein